MKTRPVMTRISFKAPRLELPLPVTDDDIKRVRIAAAAIACGIPVTEAWRLARSTVDFERTLKEVAG